MDQRCSAIVKYWTAVSNVQMSTFGHNSCHQPESPSINRFNQFNDRLSVSQTLPQLIYISHCRMRMLTYPLLQHRQDHAINRTEVGYVKKPQVWCYELQSLATKRLVGCAHTLCWRAVLLKLSWFSAFDCIKNVKYACDKNLIRYIRMPKIIKKIELGLTKLLQK